MKLVVIGGSGLIGSKLVEKLREAGHDPLAASPNSGVDTLTGEGLAEALGAARVVVDVSNAPDWNDAAVLEFFLTSTRNILAAAATLGVATTWRCRSSAPTGCPTAGTSGPSSPRRKRSRGQPCPTRSSARRSSSSSSAASPIRTPTARRFAYRPCWFSPRQPTTSPPRWRSRRWARR
jgi:hypothetical protein